MSQAALTLRRISKVFVIFENVKSKTKELFVYYLELLGTIGVQ